MPVNTVKVSPMEKPMVSEDVARNSEPQTSNNSHMENNYDRVKDDGDEHADDVPQVAMARWIVRHVNARKCSKCVLKEAKVTPQKSEDQCKRDKPSDPNNRNALCHCGYKFSEHTKKQQNAYKADDQDWKVTKNTEAVPTDAFGDMEFTAYGQRTSQFIRADYNSDMDTMLELMMEYWGLQRPNLLISVTGGAKNFTMKPRLKEVFRRGLMKAAESTGAWITTGGMNAGVMKHVGEAVRDHMVAHGQKNKIIAIGIGTWGCVNNKEALIDPKGSWPAKYKAKESKVRRQSPLDPNHSHFILVDDGTQHKFGVEIALRAKLETKISQLKTSGNKDSGVSVPVVQVVLEGGPGTLETVKSAIQSGTPAVIVEGSGRAADVLAYAYSKSSEEEVEVVDKFGKNVKRVVPIFDDGLWSAVREKIIEEWKTDKDIDIRVAWVRECLEKRDHMTVFRLDGADSAKDIDLAILQALLKVNKGNPVDQLKLALAWNRIDVARTEIFTDDAKWEGGDLDEVMYTAILEDKEEFVKLFLENGVSFRDFLTKRRLLQLYNDIPRNCLLHQLLTRKKDKKRTYFNFDDIGYLIASLTGDFYRPLYLHDNRYKRVNAETMFSFNFSNELLADGSVDELVVSSPDTGALIPSTGTTVYDEQTGEEVTIADFDEPARELFMWSILMHRQNMSMLFWDEGREGIAAALTAQMISKLMLKQTDDSELEKELERQVEHFQDLSVGVLTECYAVDEKKAQLLLVRELPNFGRATVLLLAVEADNKTFIAHAACQSLLNNIWRGRMTSDNGMIRMWLCIFCPFLIFPLIKYREDDRLQLSEYDTKRTRQKEVRNDIEMKNRPSLQRHNTSIMPSQPDIEPAKDKISVWQRIGWFYNAPVITFIHNCLFYIAFLILYGIIMLTDFKEQMSTKEIILIVWVFTLFVEEVRQVLADESSNIGLKFRSYISDVWNILDVTTMLSFVVGMILRAIPNNPNCFEAARIILALNLMTFFFRILHIFSVHKQLGPKLVMIGRMMVDLCFFVIILMVFIVAYGLASQAILYPNSPLEIGLIQDVLRKAYWQIYGELFLEEIEGDIDCTSDPILYLNKTLPRCPENTWAVPLLLGVYILITNVLMLNLLIAMFSYTFERVQSQTDLYWHFQNFNIIKEYYLRPPLAPPLIIFSHMYIVFRGLLRCCCAYGRAYDAFRLDFSDGEVKQLILWEKVNSEEYQRSSQADEKQSLENRVKETNERVDMIQHTVDEMAESSFMTRTTTNNTQVKLPPVLDDRLNYIEEQLKRTSKALDWIISNMGGSGNKGPNLPNIDELRETTKMKQKQELEKKKEEFKDMLKRQLELHIKSRTSRYPCSDEAKFIYRFNVPDAKVPWEMEWDDYEPVQYTDQTILDKPVFADDNLIEFKPSADATALQLQDIEEREVIKFNQLGHDRHGQPVDRRSHEGIYQVVDGLPLNPKGRTGLVGRGVLGRWGPNHAGDPIVTRWRRNEVGEIVSDGGKKVLEFVSIQRSDNQEWAIPGALMLPGQAVFESVKAEFKEEAMGLAPDEKNEEMGKIKELWNKGKEVYKGYADDPRNTDNAWIETIAINYHDETGTYLRNLRIKAGKTVDTVRWQKVNGKESLYGGHLGTLQKVAEMHGASF